MKFTAALFVALVMAAASATKPPLRSPRSEAGPPQQRRRSAGQAALPQVGGRAKGGTKAMAKGGKDENGKSITAKNMGESSAVAGLVCGPGRQGNGARDGVTHTRTLTADLHTTCCACGLCRCEGNGQGRQGRERQVHRRQEHG
eukprot:XP_001699231.1 predicted protein [Chlamydomonas reinhardtii]